MSNPRVSRALLLATVLVACSVLSASVVAAGQASLRFAAFGDAHYSTAPEPFYAGNIVEAWLTDPGFPEFDFAFQTGDFIQERADIWRVGMEDSLNKMLLPWFFAFGNHDITALEAGLRESGAIQPCYAFMWDNILFLVHGWMGDYGSPDDPHGYDQGGVSKEVQAWLEFMTFSYPNNTTIIVSHGGPRSGDQAFWESLIENNPQIALFVHGHNHQFGHYTFHGVDVVQTGIVNGVEKWGGSPWTEFVEITEDSIKAGVYDVFNRQWLPDVMTIDRKLDTGVKDTGIEWYSVMRFVRDGETFVLDNRILPTGVTVQLIGSDLQVRDGRVLERGSDGTKDFWLTINGKSFANSGTLNRGEAVEFSLPITALTNRLECVARMGGSGTGFVSLVYQKPQLWSSALSFGVASVAQDECDVSVRLVAQYAADQIALIPFNAGVSVKGANLTPVRGGRQAFTIPKAGALSGIQVKVIGLEVAPEPVLIKEPSLPADIVLSQFVVPESVNTLEPFEVRAAAQSNGAARVVELGIFLDSELVGYSDPVLLLPGQEKEVVVTLELMTPGNHTVALGSLEPKEVRATVQSFF